jgi:hypothetical protein
MGEEDPPQHWHSAADTMVAAQRITTDKKIQGCLWKRRKTVN